jgi:alkanesulfonate monooxygenase
MSLDIFWFLPTSGDTRYLGKSDFGRQATNAYMRIAVTADQLGYDGLLIPTGASCLDPWVTAASLIPVTQRIKLLVALRTSLGNPTASARQAATLDQALGEGRLLLNVVPGGDATEPAADGVFYGHDERYEAGDEFLTIWRGLLSGEKVDFDGKHLKVQGAEFLSARQQALSAAVFRRVVAGGARVGCEACRCLFDLGRTAGRRGREDRRRAAASRRYGRKIGSACGCM